MPTEKPFGDISQYRSRHNQVNAFADDPRVNAVVDKIMAIRLAAGLGAAFQHVTSSDAEASLSRRDHARRINHARRGMRR